MANSQALNLKVEKLTWTEKWLPGYNHVHVEISLDGMMANGSGIDRVGDTAFIKAGVEAVERIICLQNKISSNGVAGHIDDALAKQNAKYELLERDAFLSHYLTRTPLIDIELGKNALYQKIVEKLTFGVDFQVFAMKTPEDYFGHFCLCTPAEDVPAEFSSIIGLGFSDERDKSLSKSMLECYPNVIWHLIYEEKRPSIDQNTFARKG